MTTFDEFWAIYPRHDAKKDARKAWDRLNPDPALQQQIADALAWQTVSEQWTKDDGQYVPMPATYLRGERWTDERRTSERRIEQRRQTWAFDCPHTPLCRDHFGCVQLRKKVG